MAVCRGENCKCEQYAPWCLAKVTPQRVPALLQKLEKASERALAQDEAGERDTSTQPAGLQNLGNTCLYFRLTPLRNALFHWEPPKVDAELPARSRDIAAATKTLQELYAYMLAGHQMAYSPADLVKSLKLDREQQDATEFGAHFLNLFSDPATAELQRVIDDLFSGSTETHMRCDNKCDRPGRAEEFKELAVQIAKAPDLSAALAANFGEERLDDFRCDCGTVGATRVVRLAKAPPILSLQISRYGYDRETNERKKIQKRMTYPRQVNVSGLLKEGHTMSDEECMYELIGILVHNGDSAHAGHYFSIVFDPEMKKWFLFNDKEVDDLSDAQMAFVFGEETKGSTKQLTATLKGANMLVYRRAKLGWPTGALSAQRSRKRNSARMIKDDDGCLGPRLQALVDQESDLTELNHIARTTAIMDKQEAARAAWATLQTELDSLRLKKVSEEELELGNISFLPLRLLRNIVEETLERIGGFCKQIKDDDLDPGDSDDKPAEKEKNGGSSPDDEPKSGSASPDLSVSAEFGVALNRADLDKVLCPHGRIPLPTAKTWSWRGVSRAAAEEVLRSHGGATGLDSFREQIRDKDSLCQDCFDPEAKAPSPTEKAEKDFHKDVMKRLGGILKPGLEDLLPKHAETRLFNSKTHTHLLCRSAFNTIRQFLKRPANWTEPKLPLNFCNSCLLCPHGQFKFPLTDETPGNIYWKACGFRVDNGMRESEAFYPPFYPLTTPEWTRLGELAKAAATEGLSEYVEEGDVGPELRLVHDHGTLPEMGLCDECVSKIFDDSVSARFAYSDARLNFKKLLRKESGVPMSSGRPLAAPSPTPPPPSPSEGKRNGGAGGSVWEPQMPTRTSARRTNRLMDASHRIDKVKHTDTVNNIKMRIYASLGAMPNDMTLYAPDGRELADSDTLADSRILDGDLIRVEIDPDLATDDAKSVKKVAKERSPERGFTGSIFSS